MILEALSYIGAAFGFSLLVLAIACGLYYLSEMVEERSEPAKRILRRMIQAIMATLVLLWLVDGLPLIPILFSLMSYLVYMQNLKGFPYVALTSPVFLTLCVLVISNHFLWFRHFNSPHIPTVHEMMKSDYQPPRIASFLEVASFFGLMVWLLPFALFVSLSAHDGLLPHHAENTPQTPKKAGLAKVVVRSCREFVYSVARQFGYELDPGYGCLG